MARTFAVYLAEIGRPELNSVRESITFFVNLLLNLVLIPYIGIVGAALATSGAYFLSFLIAVQFYGRETKTYPWLKILFNQDLLALSLKNARRYLKT